MKLLLDTHAMLWYVDQNPRLSPVASSAIQDPFNERILSAASYWEIAIKATVLKIGLSADYLQFMAVAKQMLNFNVLPISIDHAARLVSLPRHHRDPFDRMLAAQALTEDVVIVSADSMFDSYGVTRIW